MESISEERLNMLDLLVVKIVFISRGIKEAIKKKLKNLQISWTCSNDMSMWEQESM